MISSRFTSALFTTALFLLPVAAQYYKIDSPGKQLKSCVPEIRLMQHVPMPSARHHKHW
ncbi:hypothetical protein E4U32_005578, partial [Claviceps aff. humidiphila group G2b]